MNGPALVMPYCGQNQQSRIPVPATTAYRQSWEEGVWSMPPYQQIFPDVPNSQDEARPKAFLPPPLKKTDLFSAQQTWPL